MEWRDVMKNEREIFRAAAFNCAMFTFVSNDSFTYQLKMEIVDELFNDLEGIEEPYYLEDDNTEGNESFYYPCYDKP